MNKSLRDTVYQEVQVHRYQNLLCKRTFRVYPEGITRADLPADQRAGSDALSAGTLLWRGLVGVRWARRLFRKSRVYDAVQEAARRVPRLKREQVFASVKKSAVGGDLTSVKCKGKWLPLGLTTDAISGLALTIDALSAEDSQALKAWIEPITKSVGASVLVTDDADGFKTDVDDLGLDHQVCKAHVVRNTETLIERYQPLVTHDADGSLQVPGISQEQAAADLQRLGELVKSRQSAQATELEALHRRYQEAPPPRAEEQASLAYCLRLLYLDRWNLRHRLTRYRHWQGLKKVTLASTNTATERAIGWWIK